MDYIRKLLINIALPLIVFAVSGCEVYTDINTSVDSSADFSSYHTFAWLPDETDTSKLPYNNEIIRNNIRNYFGHSFSARGYTVNLDSPDVLLRVVIQSEKKERLIAYYHHPAPYYYHKYYYGSIWYHPYPIYYYYRDINTYCYPPECTIRKLEYIESSITLNVIDRKKNKLVWSGTAKGDIYDPDYINRNIHPAVESIMKKYPVREIAKRKKALNAISDDIYN